MAEGINKVILVGNLGKDPETGYTPSGTARCRLTIATTESYMANNNERQEKTEWHNVVVWGKQAESVGRFLSKGRQVYIEGRLQTRSWDDEKSGQKKYMTEINAQRVIFLGGGRGEGGSGGPAGGHGGPAGGHGGSGGGHGGSGGSHGGGRSGGEEFTPQDGGAFNPPDDDIPF